MTLLSNKVKYISYWDKLIKLISIITFKLIPHKMLEFGVVGLTGILIQLIFFYFLNFINENSFVKNNLSAIVVGTIFGYILNNLLTFNKKKLKGKDFIVGMFMFLFFSLLTISINILISFFVFNILKVKIIAILSGTISGFLSNFFITRKIIWNI